MPPTRETPRIIAGRYTIERVLGRGATANVYLARDAQTGDQVAVKVLLPEIAHGIGIARFLREIRLTSPFNHPNIVRILDSGIAEDDLPFFVMPYMEGGSLRERLARDSQLPLSEAARITQDVAEALAHAHSLGLIHRDVKPENILFFGGRAMVSDFGIARAIAGSENISGTTPGVIRGTPAYMSPEQASGEADLDGRSDVYSLACVAYEMIAGLPPFVGPNARNVMAQRMTRDALAIQTYRSSAPAAISDVMKRAMAVDPADRESDPREFARQLGESLAAPSGTHTANNTAASQPPTARSRMWIGGVAAVVGVAALASAPVVRRSFVDASLDSLRIAVASMSATDPETAGPRLGYAARAVSAEVSSWSDVRATMLSPVTDRNPAAARSTLVVEAKRSRSRWLVELQSQAVSDHVMVDAALVDASNGQEMKRARTNVPLDSVSTPAAYGGLVASLFGGNDSDTPGADSLVSFLAWRAYVQGRGEMQRWQLDSAESSLGMALRLSPSFEAAALRLGQVAVWLREPVTAASRTGILRALQRVGLMSTRDSLLARAVLAMDAKNPIAACAAYDRMRRLDSLDVVAWLGLGDCNTRDHLVIRDAKSPSGMRFRSSYQAGISSYLRATQLDPIAGKLLLPLNNVGPLITSTNRIIMGPAAAPDTTIYAGYPTLDPRGDTILVVPYPLSILTTTALPSLSGRDDQAIGRLVERHKDLLVRFASAWVGATPRDPDGHEALSAALELRGDVSPGTDESSSAVAALAAGRRLASEPRQRVRMAISSVRLSVKAGDFQAARALTDSVLKSAAQENRHYERSAAEARSLASLAALIGRDDDLRRWLVLANTSGTEGNQAQMIPSQAMREVATLTAVIVLRRCDSIGTALERAEATLRRFVAPSNYAAAWSATIPRLLSLATPCDEGRSVLAVHNPTDRLIVSQQAYARHDFRAVRAELDTLERFRGFARPGDIALDYTLQEAWLLQQIGDTARALARLKQTVEALPTLSLELLNWVDQAAAVCGTLSLGSLLARERLDAKDAVAWERDRRVLCGALPSTR